MMGSPGCFRGMEDKMKNTYNGWRNRETWVVKIWLDNDGFDPQSNRELANVHDIEEFFREVYCQDMPENGPLSDLLEGALQSVDWREISESYADELEDEEGDEE
jgi:hypothetical protein